MNKLGLQDLSEKINYLYSLISDIIFDDKDRAISHTQNYWLLIEEIKNFKGLDYMIDAIDIINEMIDNNNDRPFHYSTVKKMTLDLISFILRLKILLEKNFPKIDNDSITITLPPTKNFNDLAKYSRDLHTAISQIVINDEINGLEEIISVENGSIKINVKLGAAITLIAGVIWSAYVINKKRLEGEVLEQQIRAYNAKNESIEDILEAQKAYTKMLIEAEAKNLDTTYFKTSDPERIERLKNSIIILSNLINKGAEFQPALMAPEEVSNLFPSNPLQIESRIPKIDKE